MYKNSIQCKERYTYVCLEARGENLEFGMKKKNIPGRYKARHSRQRGQRGPDEIYFISLVIQVTLEQDP